MHYIVPDMEEQNGKLNVNRMLWNVGIVVKDLMVFDKAYKAIKNLWWDVKFFSKLIWMIMFKVS